MWIWFIPLVVVLIVLYYCLRKPKSSKYPKKTEHIEMEKVDKVDILKKQNELFKRKGYHRALHKHNSVSCPVDGLYIRRIGNHFDVFKDSDHILFTTSSLKDNFDGCWSNHSMVVLLCKHYNEFSLKVYDFDQQLLFMTEPFVFLQGIWFLNNGFYCLGIFNSDVELRYYSLDDLKGFLIKSYANNSQISLNILPLLDQDVAILSEYPDIRVELISNKQTEKLLRLLATDHLATFGVRNEHFYSFDAEMNQIVISNVVMISNIFHIEPPIHKGQILNAVLFDTHLIAIIWTNQTEYCITIFDELVQDSVDVITSSVNYNGAFVDCPIINITPNGYGFHYKCEYIHIAPIIFKYEKEMASIAMEIPMDIDIDYVHCFLNDFKLLLLCPKSFNIQKSQYVRVILSADKRYNACQSIDFVQERQGLVIYFDISNLHSRNMTLYLQYYKQLLSFVKELSCYDQMKTTFYGEGLGASLIAMNLTNDACEYMLKDGIYEFDNDLILQSPAHLTFVIKSVILVIGSDKMSLDYLIHLQETCEKAYGYIEYNK